MDKAAKKSVKWQLIKYMRVGAVLFIIILESFETCKSDIYT